HHVPRHTDRQSLIPLGDLDIRPRGAYASEGGVTGNKRVASRNDLDLGAQTLGREAAFPPYTDRPLRTVARDHPAQDPNAVLAKPHDPSAYHLPRIHLTGNLDDRLVAVLFELALTESSHRARQLGFRHLRTATASCRIRASDEPNVEGRPPSARP